MSCISFYTDLQNTSGAAGQSYSYSVNLDPSLGLETGIEYPTNMCNASSHVWILLLSFRTVVSTSFCISLCSITNLLNLLDVLLFELDNISTLVPQPMVVTYVSLFALQCDSVVEDNCCPSMVGNDGCEYSSSKNIILSKMGGASVIVTSDALMLDLGLLATKV